MEIVARSGWGAARPKQAPVRIEQPVAHLFLHHTAGPDGGPQQVRNVQRFHQETRQWQDVAYSVLYSPQHRTFFEGRGLGVRGAHTRGYNSTGHAVAVLGNYELEPLPVSAIEDLTAFARWHAAAGYGPSTYTPHRAVGATSCPGKNLVAVLDVLNGLEDAPAAADPVENETEDDELDEVGLRWPVEWGAWERNLAGNYYTGPR